MALLWPDERNRSASIRPAVPLTPTAPTTPPPYNGPGPSPSPGGSPGGFRRKLKGVAPAFLKGLSGQ